MYALHNMYITLHSTFFTNLIFFTSLRIEQMMPEKTRAQGMNIERDS